MCLDSLLKVITYRLIVLLFNTMEIIIQKNKLSNAVLDRTFVDAKNNRWIIDYKISRHEGENSDAFLDHEQERYRKQLEKYGSLMKQLGEKNIKLGLYFPLLQGWREWKQPKKGF